MTVLEFTDVPAKVETPSCEASAYPKPVSMSGSEAAVELVIPLPVHAPLFQPSMIQD